MGETTSYIVDAKVLEVLTMKLGIVISMEALDATVKDTVMLIKNN